MSERKQQSQWWNMGTIVAWFRHHQKTAIASYQRLIRQPIQTLMTCSVIAIAIVLPSLLLIVTKAVGNVGEHLQQGNPLSIYLDYATTDKQRQQLTTWLTKQPEIISFETILANRGLAQFEQWSGLGNLIASLDQNPLPDVVVLQLQKDLSVEQIQTLLTSIGQAPSVGQVQLDLEWVARLQQISRLFEQAVLIFSTLFALGILLVIGNTIRLEIENRRSEIVVIKLVGGSDAFVRRPFLYTGLWYGLIGGALSIVIILLALFWLSAPIAELMRLYSFDQPLLIGFGFSAKVLIILIATSLGLLGAWLAVGQHLDSIEPS